MILAIRQVVGFEALYPFRSDAEVLPLVVVSALGQTAVRLIGQRDHA